MKIKGDCVRGRLSTVSVLEKPVINGSYCTITVKRCED